MNSENISKENKNIKHWYLNLILGSTLILAALWVFCNPQITYNSLAKLFGIALFFTSALEIISSYQYRNLLNEWRLPLIIGILDLLVGIIIISQHELSTETLTLIMGFVFLYRSVKFIFWSTKLKKYESRNFGWVLFGGISGFMLSFILIWNWIFPTLTLLFFTSFALLLIGISELHFSLELKNYHKNIFKWNLE